MFHIEDAFVCQLDYFENIKFNLMDKFCVFVCLREGMRNGKSASSFDRFQVLVDGFIRRAVIAFSVNWQMGHFGKWTMEGYALTFFK